MQDGKEAYMRYPIKCNWISYEPGSRDKEYVVMNHLADMVYIVDEEDIRFIEKLDGKTDPARLLQGYSRNEIRSYLEQLEDMDLIRNSRAVVEGSHMWTVHIVKNNIRYQTFAKVINWFFMLSVFPLLYLAWNTINKELFYLYFMGTSGMWVTIGGYVFGLISGMVLHELGHAISCTAYGGNVMEFGLMWEEFPGAYTLIDPKSIKRRMNRIQTYLAGVEVNFILAALYAIIMCYTAEAWKDGTGFWMEAAFVNLILGFMNILMIDGVDGMKIMQEIIGDDDLIDSTQRVLKDRRKRVALAESECGNIKLLAARLFGLTRVIYPLVIIMNFVIIIF